VLCDRIQEKVSAYHQAPSIIYHQKEKRFNWNGLGNVSRQFRNRNSRGNQTSQITAHGNQENDESKQGQMLNQVDAIHPATKQAFG
jgi:hypothetical protein